MVFRPADEILRRGSTARNLYHLLLGTTACVAANGQVLDMYIRGPAPANWWDSGLGAGC